MSSSCHWLRWVIFVQSTLRSKISDCFSHLLILFSFFLYTFLRTATPGSRPVISWGKSLSFPRCELLESEVLPCSWGDMSAGPLCPLTWFRRVQRRSKTTSTTDLRESGRSEKEKKKERDWFWLPIKCMWLDSCWLWCMWGWFGALLHLDLGICFTLESGPAVIALKLGRSSSCNHCLWNSQAQALKVLQGYWSIKFVKVTSQRCGNPLWHFLL